MEPKDIRRAMGSNHAMDERMYQQYIAPFIINKKPSNIPYFFGVASLAWMINIQKEDLSNMLFVMDICEKAYTSNPAEFVEMLSFVLSEQYESHVRLAEADDDLTRAKTRGEIKGIFSNQLAVYKSLFESGFKFSGSVPYFYLGTTGAVTSQATTGEEYAYVSAGEKFQKLSKFSTVFLKGDVKDLTKGFDNRVRNAGSGHDSWKITDDEKVELTVTDPKTGKKKDVLEFTQKEFDVLIKQCRRTLWVLRVGLDIYLENNPDVYELIKKEKNHTIFEIADATASFAENRLIDIKDLKLSKENNVLTFSASHRPQIVGTKGQMFFGGDEAFDIVHKIERVELEYQLFDVMKYALSFLDVENLPSLKISVQVEDDEKVDVEFHAKEMEKLFIEEGEIQVPVPTSGKIPDYEVVLNLPIKVPYGTRDMAIKIMESDGWEVKG
jgi:hypothetical protein